MSPRKSSTSSANRSPRPRYLGIEVAGDFSVPGRWVELELQRLLASAEGAGSARVRVIRWEGRRGLVEIEHLQLVTARLRWNVETRGPNGGAVRVRTHRTWGTLRKGKRWLAEPVPPAGPSAPRLREV